MTKQVRGTVPGGQEDVRVTETVTCVGRVLLSSPQGPHRSPGWCTRGLGPCWTRRDRPSYQAVLLEHRGTRCRRSRLPRAGSGLTSGRSWISRTFLGCCPLPGPPLADPAPSHTVQGTLTPGLREVEDRSFQQGQDGLCHMWPQGRVGANRSLRS